MLIINKNTYFCYLHTHHQNPTPITVDKRFAQCLHRRANARKSFAEVNPYATPQAAAEAGDRLVNRQSTEDNILEILDEEKAEAEALMADAQQVTLMSIAQQRAVLALIISGQYRAMKHIRLRNLVVEVYDAPSIPQIMQAVALDRKLAKEQRQLQLAIDMETNPTTVALPAPRKPAAPKPQPPAAEKPTAKQPEPTPEPPQEKQEPTSATPGQFTNPDPGYMPIMQKIALREAEEANLTIEQRLERDYQYNEHYKQMQKEKRRGKRRG